MARKSSRKNKKIDALTAIIAIIVVIIAVAYYYYGKKQEQNKYSLINEIFNISNPLAADEDGLSIHFIDIGQGDCIFVDFPDGKSMLIDSGDRGKGDIVVDYLKDLGVSEITLVIATHTDADHIGGMVEVFESFKIQFCLRPFVYYNGDDKSMFDPSFNVESQADKKKNCSTATYRNFLSAILNENCGYDYFNMDTDFTQAFTYLGGSYEYSLDFLTPIKDAPQIGYSDPNDYSPFMVLSYKDFSIMFTGDAESVAEAELLSAYANLPDVDVLKVGHHGSATSTSLDFLYKVSPEYSVIMCGVANKYQHPRQEVLDRLIGVGSEIRRTDLNGNIVLKVNGHGEYSFNCQKHADPADLITGFEGVE